MCVCGCNIDVECEGKTASVRCSRPTWEEVYRGYMGGVQHHRSDIVSARDQHQSLSASSAAVVSYAVSSTSAGGTNSNSSISITDVEELKNWLSGDSVWKTADIDGEIFKGKTKDDVLRIMGGCSGVIIVKRENTFIYAHLWDKTNLINDYTINDSNIIIKDGDIIYFWGLKYGDEKNIQGDRTYSIDPKMVDEVKIVGWGQWRSAMDDGTNCNKNAVEAVRRAYGVKYGSTNGFDNSYIKHNSCIAGNWNQSIQINAKHGEHITNKQYDEMKAKQLNFKTNHVINEFMLDYIRKCINMWYPVVIGVSEGKPALKEYKIINDQVTSHFLVLTSYTLKGDDIVRFSGFDNRNNPAIHVIFTVNDGTKEMYKLENDFEIEYKYQITQVRMWKDVPPDNIDKIIGVDWGSWGSWRRR